MDKLLRPSTDHSLAALVAALVDQDGSAAHSYCAPAINGDRHSFVRDLVDFADFVHLVSLLHGQVPGLIDHAAARTVEVSARGWLLKSIDAFAVERQFLGKLSVAVGPLPSTTGHHETTTIIAQQRHAIEMLAQSDRRGTAFGTAVTLVLEWQAIRAVLDAGAIRLGIEPPVSTLPTRAETLSLLADMPDPERLTRAVQFGATQLLGQHRGMWDLLKARSAVRATQA
ncbi:DUF6975 family protein [Sphingobium nicotianae]|uniref:Uncharacterized protein n=1 Tax=Sphingobium nicotianae TaxID=2782607 RepID=A0A9X1IRT8_9SPHN|nr:hypothetical protein [Sphingobium nicotianae]MBT2187707.1 hypothetical protein [Sphingobium nicotianae]